MPFIRTAALVLLVQGAALGSANAQTVFKPATTVFVQPIDGAPEMKGRLIEFGPETLTLLVKEQRVTMPVSHVRSIDLHGDPVKDGAVIGAVAMGAWSAFVFARWVPNEPRAALTAIVCNAGIGALMGAGADALHRGRTPLYRRTDVTITPTKRGMGLSFRFRY